MRVNVKLIQSIKRNLAELPSDDLQKMLEKRDLSQYSDEAFVAAQEVLDDRARGQSKEPPPRLPPPPESSPAQRAAAADALLRRQVRLIGSYYYFLACLWFFFGLLFVGLTLRLQMPPITLLEALAFAVPGVFFWLLGRAIRRFSPTARIVAMLISIPHVLAFPIGTIIGVYCFDKLMRADQLFGGKGHPGEQWSPETSSRFPDENTVQNT